MTGMLSVGLLLFCSGATTGVSGMAAIRQSVVAKPVVIQQMMQRQLASIPEEQYW